MEIMGISWEFHGDNGNSWEMPVIMAEKWSFTAEITIERTG